MQIYLDHLQNQLVQLFETPAVLNKLDGQPVKQLGMRRWFTLRAKIVARLHQARAEQQSQPRAPRVRRVPKAAAAQDATAENEGNEPAAEGEAAPKKRRRRRRKPATDSGAPAAE